MSCPVVDPTCPCRTGGPCAYVILENTPGIVVVRDTRGQPVLA
jgi:hypothetical protein